MTYANADVYAPDDASILPDGSMQRTSQDIYRVIPERPRGAVTAPTMNPWISVGILAAVFIWWKKRKRG